MASTNKNVLAVILWVIGLLGATGYINRFGFFALLIPLLFILFGTSFTRSHAKEYFNILLTSVVVYVVGIVINEIVSWFKYDDFNFTFIALVYFAIMSAVGLVNALNSKRFKAPMTVRIFK